MKTFDVYKHPTQGYEVVKMGFSWPAFFFTWLWAFIKKLWGYGLAALGLLFVFVIIEAEFQLEGSRGGVLVMSLFQLGVLIWFGQMGNKWRTSNLKKRGYEHIQTLQAETSDAAIASVAKPNASETVPPPTD